MAHDPVASRLFGTFGKAVGGQLKSGRQMRGPLACQLLLVHIAQPVVHVVVVVAVGRLGLVVGASAAAPPVAPQEKREAEEHHREEDDRDADAGLGLVARQRVGPILVAELHNRRVQAEPVRYVLGLELVDGDRGREQFVQVSASACCRRCRWLCACHRLIDRANVFCC